MAVRKRTWVWKRRARTAWVVDYFDAGGVRRLKTFRTKGAADDWNAGTRIDLNRGVHVADADSVTVRKAGELWLAACQARQGDERLERSTLEQYRRHLELHITPFIGTLKLSKLNLPAIRVFSDRLRGEGRSAALVRKVLVSLGSVVTDAMERGLATHNPVRDRKRRNKATARHMKRLEVGVDVPTPTEVRTLLVASAGRWHAFVATAALGGLRLSEMRGLAWQDVSFTASTVTVRQRADAWSDLGSPKAAASRRTIPVPSLVIKALKEWRLASPKGDLGLVFPNNKGGVEGHGNAIPRGWQALQIAAGVSVPTLDDGGKAVLDSEGTPVMRAKYPGLHTLRHFFASWCATRPKDGGLGLPLKTVQARMGHSTLAMTADTYGHLFPSLDDAEVLAAGERALMGNH